MPRVQQVSVRSTTRPRRSWHVRYLWACPVRLRWWMRARQLAIGESRTERLHISAARLCLEGAQRTTRARSVLGGQARTLPVLLVCLVAHHVGVAGLLHGIGSILRRRARVAPALDDNPASLVGHRSLQSRVD